MTHTPPPVPPSSPPRPDAPAAEAPRLTDRAALDRQRRRAARTGTESWPHEIAIEEVQSRLAEVNRVFTSPAIVTALPGLWGAAFPAAKVVADTPVLALAPAAHDLVIHAMALHWADDPVGQIVQCARALRPDGLFLAVLPGGRSLAPLRDALAQAEVEQSGGLSPRVVPMAELRDLGGLLARAGLALPVADQMVQRVSYRDLVHLAHDLRAMGEGNALARRLRRPTRRGVLTRAAALLHDLAPDPDAPGRIRLDLELMFLTAWAPAPDQPQPLRPGSAQVSLAEALRATAPAPAKPPRTE